MKIGLFTDTYFPQINGVGSSVATLSEALKNLGHEVFIFTPTDPKAPAKEDDHIIRMPSMPCVFVKQFRMGLVYSPKELTKIARLHLDIIHTQTEFSLGLFGKILSKTMRIPMVHTYHTMYEDYVHYIVNGALITPSMAQDFSRIFCNHANVVIAPTKKVQHVLTDYGVSKPIAVIPTGIKLDKFQKNQYAPEEILSLRASLGLAADTPVILSLGRVAKEKSIDVVLSAMPALLKKLPQAVLVIVGDGPVRKELEALANSLGIASAVRFIGAKPWSEIGKYYQLGNVFVSASVTETQGLTFIEAMAAGIPVVAKQDESIKNVVADGVNGFLFQEDSELSEKLYTLLTDRLLYRMFSTACLSYADTLSAEAFGKSMEALYSNILYEPEKYGLHKHSKLSPIFLGKKAVQKLERWNEELSTDLLEKSKTLVKIAAKPTHLILHRPKKKELLNEEDFIQTSEERWQP